MHSIAITGQLNGGVELAQEWIVPALRLINCAAQANHHNSLNLYCIRRQNGGNYSHSSLKIAEGQKTLSM